MNHPRPSIAVNAPPIPVFAELRKPDPPSGQLALTIQHNHMEIQIYRGADAAIVETALLAIKVLRKRSRSRGMLSDCTVVASSMVRLLSGEPLCSNPGWLAPPSLFLWMDKRPSHRDCLPAIWQYR